MHKILVFLIVGYQKVISPYVSPSCRFHPSCSEYGKQAILQFGVFRGIGLTLWRLLKCNPFGPHGVDLLPPQKRETVNG
ncbi:MAG TPA: membrane protein insertion efficiency factor YidD [Bdellovibrionota bacterium]|nr:membrane protein insertion efficiency factor YidD [Bdellovibrionota bacterium]